jgi:SAM-dependent methyltransferase
VDAIDRERALQTRGISNASIYRAIATALDGCPLGPSPVLLDIGCGRGFLREAIGDRFARYVGADIVRHPEFPEEQPLILHNLASGPIPLDDDAVDVAIAAEVTCHLENPRLLVREMTRLTRPGGWVIVTNPNVLSLLSLLTLLLRKQFNAFQDCAYPQMITPVLEVDLLRMAAENGLVEPRIFYNFHGRIGSTGWHYPRAIARALPRWCSDNLGLIARKPLRQN